MIDFNTLMNLALMYGRPELASQKLHDVVMTGVDSMQDSHLDMIQEQIRKSRDIFDKIESMLVKERDSRARKAATAAKAAGKDAGKVVTKEVDTPKGTVPAQPAVAQAV